jgi:hypothetical protein
VPRVPREALGGKTLADLEAAGDLRRVRAPKQVLKVKARLFLGLANMAVLSSLHPHHAKHEHGCLAWRSRLPSLKWITHAQTHKRTHAPMRACTSQEQKSEIASVLHAAFPEGGAIQC